MTVAKEENENSANVPRRRGGFWSGRSEFIVVGLLYAIGIFLAIGTAQMNVQGSASPGPRLFPILVCLVLFLSGTLLAVQILRKPNVPDNRVHPGARGILRRHAPRHCPDFSRSHDPRGRPRRSWRIRGQDLENLLGLAHHLTGLRRRRRSSLPS